MRKGKNPTREQKEFLKRRRKDWTQYLFITYRPEDETYIFRHKETGETLELSKRPPQKKKNKEE